MGGAAVGHRSRSRRRAAVAVALAIGAGLVPVTAAAASTGVVEGGSRAAAVQAVLDRIVGPGNSIVEIADTVQSSSSTTSAVTWGSGAASSVGWSRSVVAGVGSTSSVAQQNAVGSTRTVTATPAGRLLRQSVSVAIDRRALGSTPVARVRHLIAAAAGVSKARGDRITVLVTRFAAVAPAAAAAPVPLWSVVARNALPSTAIAVGAVLLLVLGARRLLRRGSGAAAA